MWPTRPSGGGRGYQMGSERLTMDKISETTNIQVTMSFPIGMGPEQALKEWELEDTGHD